jgi:hypothetical protein
VKIPGKILGKREKKCKGLEQGAPLGHRRAARNAEAWSAIREGKGTGMTSKS